MKITWLPTVKNTFVVKIILIHFIFYYSGCSSEYSYSIQSNVKETFMKWVNIGVSWRHIIQICANSRGHAIRLIWTSVPGLLIISCVAQGKLSPLWTTNYHLHKQSLIRIHSFFLFNRYLLSICFVPDFVLDRKCGERELPHLHRHNV